MNEKEFSKLIKKDKYQAFLFTSPLPFPFSFSLHSWIVTSNKGKIKRWEIIHLRNLGGQRTGYFYINLLKPSQRMNKIFRKNFFSKEDWNSKIQSSIIGGKGSTAEKLINFMEKNAIKYPYKNRYLLLTGPNCHTFTSWVSSHFPQAGFKLPWYSFQVLSKIGTNFR